jgi:hypothetical protein
MEVREEVEEPKEEAQEMSLQEARQAIVELGEEKKESEDKRGSFFSAEKGTRAVYLLVGFFVIGLVFLKLQYSTDSVCCGDYDGYYHIRWSRLLWENFKSFHILPPTFTWLPLTSLNPNDYVDHHYLFHLLQIPFTWFFELTSAAKISALLFGTLAVFSCYWLIVRYQINYTLLWLLAILTSSAPFLYRMNMAKAPPLALIFLVAGTYFLFEGKYKWLTPLMFLFVWAYSLWPLMLVGAIAWCIVIAWSEERIEWRPVAFAAVGVVAGFIINPYFPKNIKLFITHSILKMGGTPTDLAVGQEWYPYDSWYLLTSCLIAFVALVIGYISFRKLDKKLSAHSLYFLIMATVLAVATFHSRRFVEYFPPFAILFAAFSIQAMLIAMSAALPSKLPDEFMRDLSPYLDRPGTSEVDKKEIQKQNILQASAFGLSLILLMILFVNVKGINSERLGISNSSSVSAEIEDMPKPDTYQKGMEWIKKNVPPGQIIFNTDWDDFPKMFFYDTTHAYVSGLDPSYLYKQNPELSQLYVDITLGKDRSDDPNFWDNIGLIFRDKFKAQYVFSDDGHADFYVKAMESGWFDKVYPTKEDEKKGDTDCFILKLRDKKGEPPPESIDDNAPDEGKTDDNDNMPDESEEPPQ